jgi:O-antigen chain-terminating methyltransferase
LSLAEQNADLGLPVAQGSRLRFLRQMIAKATWPMLRHQTLFNHAVLQDIANLAVRVDEINVLTDQHSFSLAHHTEVLTRFEATLADHGAHLSTLADVASALRDLQGKVALIERTMADQATNLRREFFAELDQLRGVLEDDNVVTERALAEIRMHIAELDLFFAEYRRSLNAQPAQPVSVGTPSPPNAFDGIYGALEDVFRGSPAVIKDRLKVYLDEVATATAEGGVVLDLACGRGEWLEVLRDAGISATGVDTNVTYREQWKAAGLKVTNADVIEHLRSLEPGSLAVVTAFHIVEHLPLDVLIELLDLANRVLRPGGLLILESPNPENLMVGACTFYLDPTHQRPIPPPLLEFLVGARGFVDMTIRRLQSNDAEALPTPPIGAGPWAHDLSPVVEFVNAKFYGARDYAVLAHRI